MDYRQLITKWELENPTPEILAEVAKLSRDSDFRQVPVLVGAVFWRQQILSDARVLKSPELIKWTVDNAEAIGASALESAKELDREIQRDQLIRRIRAEAARLDELAETDRSGAAAEGYNLEVMLAQLGRLVAFSKDPYET